MLAPIRNWIFDLDNTLYPASCRLFDQIDVKIGAFVSNLLGIDMADSIPNRHRVVILLSDGAGNAGTFSPAEAANYACERNVPVYTVGIGSSDPVVAGYDLAGTPEYAVLDEETLRAIARTTGGKYYAAGDEGTLAAIYGGLTDEIPREPKDTSIREVFFAGALVVLFLEIYLRYGRGRILP